MQGFRGKNLTAIQKAIIGMIEVGQIYQANLVDRLLKCAQVQRFQVLDEDKSPCSPCCFCANNLYQCLPTSRCCPP